MKASCKNITVVLAVLLVAGCKPEYVEPPPPPPIQTGTGTNPLQNQQQQGTNQQVGQQVGVPGTIQLANGFTPDPHLVQGVAGGAVQGNTLEASCRGWVNQTPNHLMMATSAFGNLRFLVNGGNEDTTLIIQRPDGSYACNDDAEARHPIVQGNFQPGLLKIWVGSFQQGATTPYTLGITELPSVTAASLGSSAVPQGGGATPSSNFGTVSLRPSFTPDPHVVQGTSGGAIQGATLSGNCRGWVSQQPDHILVTQGNFNLLRVLVRSAQDTTLVIQKPDGVYLCDDDTEGRNPVIAGTFPAGMYKIWVGSYRQGQTSQYRLGFSELAGVRAQNL